MNDIWKETPFEILPNGGLCLIMPCEVDPEQEQFVFMPKVRIVDDFILAEIIKASAIPAHLFNDEEKA